MKLTRFITTHLTFNKTRLQYSV